MSATLAVVAGKLEPVKKQEVKVAVMITAQAISPAFDSYRAIAQDAAGAKCVLIRDTAAEGLRVAEALGEAGVEQFDNALAGVIQGTRSKDADDKWQDGATTDDARKFAAYVRAVFGAIYRGRMTLAEAATYTNNEKFVAEARARLTGGDAPINWRTGEAIKPTAEREAAKLERAKARAVDKVAEAAIMLGHKPEQVERLKARAAKKAESEFAAKAREDLAESAATFAASLLKRMGKVKAKAYLAKALAIVNAAE